MQLQRFVTMAQYCHRDIFFGHVYCTDENMYDISEAGPVPVFW